MSGQWIVESAGLRLVVSGPGALAGWWPQIAPWVRARPHTWNPPRTARPTSSCQATWPWVTRGGG